MNKDEINYMLSLRKKLITIAVAIVGCLAAIGLFVACEQTPETAAYQPSTFVVTFDAGYGTMHNGVIKYSVKVDKGSTVPRPTEIPQRYGYEFWGWNTTGNADDTMWKFDAEKITQDMTIYAVWVRSYKVTFYTDEGVFEDGSNEYTFTVVQGSKITPPTVISTSPTKEVRYWAVGGIEWDFSEQTVTGETWLHAYWDFKEDIRNALEPFNYSKTNDGYEIYGVRDKSISGTLTVPSIVTSIDSRAFEGCNNIASVIIADSVTEIGQRAFQNCAKLKSVTLPSRMTSIAAYAFYGCSSLDDIRLPDTVTEVGNYAFYGCSALYNVNLVNVTKIGSNAFDHCSALANVQIPAVVEIGDMAFKDCTTLKKITIPATCTDTGLDSFWNCTGLTSAELHCKSVYSGIFSGCSALADLTLGDEVVQLQSMAFRNFQGLRNVTIGDGLTSIPTDSFSYCYNLRNVKIGSGVKTISYNSFQSCHSLLSVTIPSNVTSIGSGVFTGCVRLVEVYNLSDVSYNFTNINFYEVIEHSTASDESIIHTTDDGFSFCIFKDTNVYPYDAQTLFLIDYSGNRADIVLPDSFGGADYKIYKYALSHNPKLRSVRFSAGVTEIKERILLGSDNVTSLTVDSANTVLSSANNCVINTADKMFVLGCKTSVIPADGSVTSIGDNVFCENATIESESFKIPVAVTRVSRYAFSGCEGLMRTVDNIVYVDKWAIALGNVDLNGDEKLDLQFRSGTVGIADDAFWNKDCIRSVTFNDEMRYVGMSAFNDCDELITVNFNDGLVFIGSAAFRDCDKLKEAVMPDSLATIRWGVFYDCTALTYAKLPAELAESNTQIFYNCDALDAIVIPQSIEEIGYSVFLNCPDTVNVYYCGSEQQWNAIVIQNGNTAIVNATKYFYSETQIEGVNCWHYGEGGRPTSEY